MKKFRFISFILLFAGIGCIVLKGLLPETIDENGILHEAFFLLPIGFFSIILGLIGLFVCKKH